MRDIENIEWVQFVPVGMEPDSIVWIDVSDLDQLWRLDDTYYVEPRGNGRARYSKFGHWFDDGTDPVWMPQVSIENGVVRFTDGRHRFAWLRDMGVKTLPVAVGPASVDELVSRCGARHLRT